MKNLFLRVIQRLGHRIERPDMSAAGPIQPDEVGFFAALTRRTFRQEPETYTGGKKLTVIMTTDIDPNTGKVFPDYLERRRKAREQEGPEGSCAGVFDRDVRPD
jgi:hypothetical protein